MPKIVGLLETSLYVDDMERSSAFFERVLELTPMLRGERLTAFDAGSSGVLLVFSTRCVERRHAVPDRRRARA